MKKSTKIALGLAALHIYNEVQKRERRRLDLIANAATNQESDYEPESKPLKEKIKEFFLMIFAIIFAFSVFLAVFLGIIYCFTYYKDISSCVAFVFIIILFFKTLP